MEKRILVLDGNPLTDSFCAALANAYADGAQAAGAQVQLLRLRDLRFDPILHAGYRVVMPLEEIS